MRELERLTGTILSVALRLHRDLGPGMFETVYETLLARQLEKRDLKVERQVEIGLAYDGVTFPVGFRADLIVEGRVLIELKSVEQTTKAHERQLLTYVRLARLPVGLLLNFGTPLLRMGIKRVVNHPRLGGGRLPRFDGAGELAPLLASISSAQ